MYKSRLQELCHQKQWRSPNYSCNKDGFNHNSSFKASVVVNGVSFDTPISCKSSKEAQNEAARVAIEHLSIAAESVCASIGPSTDANDNLSGEEASSYISGNSLGVKNDLESFLKNQLHNYARKRILGSPVYSCIHEGSPHAVLFTAEVRVAGHTFGCPKFFRTLKEAKLSAAEVALSSLSIDDMQENDSAFYNNLLHELIVKEGFSSPRYDTITSGQLHLLTFVSTGNRS